MTEIRFDAEAALDAARAETGLEDFGPNDFREPLDVLLRTYDANYTGNKGRGKAWRRVVRLLCTRLRVTAAFQRHPEIYERKIVRPWVLTGLPRSGTSALLNLLASDPAARPLRLWETQFPEPMEGLAPDAPDPRREAVQAFNDKGRETHPDFAKIHFVDADTPEECVLLQAYAMHGVHHGPEPLFEPYRSWFQRQDLRGTYAYYRGLLQLLDWQRPGERWLLKSPAHLWGLDALIESFPDVSIVWSHRHPLHCIPSVCSMLHLLMRDRVDLPKDQLGPLVLDSYATSLERGLAQRDAHAPERFIDIHHDAFVEDPLAMAEAVYCRFDQPWPDPVRDAMRAHVEAHPKDRHGSHAYALADWGLTPDDVVARFRPYIERFEIEV